MFINEYIKSAFMIIIGLLMVVWSISNANNSGYSRGYSDAQAELNVPVIKANMSPVKVRPKLKFNASKYCPTLLNIQQPPEKIIIDKIK